MKNRADIFVPARLLARLTASALFSMTDKLITNWQSIISTHDLTISFKVKKELT